MRTETVDRWLSFVANLGLIAGLLLVALQLQQNADLAKLQILSDNRATQQAAEIAMFGDNGAIAWAKSIESPGDLISAEIKVVDGWLVNRLMQWQRFKMLEDEGLLEAGSTENRIRTSGRFVFSNTFAKTWWKYERENNWAPEFVRMVDQSLERLDEEGNLRWLNQLKQDTGDANPESM